MLRKNRELKLILNQLEIKRNNIFALFGGQVTGLAG